MANAAVASWTACIKELQKLVDNSTTAPDAAQFTERMTQLEQLSCSPLPPAAWKTLVDKLQVLLPLSDSCGWLEGLFGPSASQQMLCSIKA